MTPSDARVTLAVTPHPHRASGRTTLRLGSDAERELDHREDLRTGDLGTVRRERGHVLEQASSLRPLHRVPRLYRSARTAADSPDESDNADPTKPAENPLKSCAPAPTRTGDQWIRKLRDLFINEPFSLLICVSSHPSVLGLYRFCGE